MIREILYIPGSLSHRNSKMYWILGKLLICQIYIREIALHQNRETTNHLIWIWF